MGRKAKPRVWREWYVSEAGGAGVHKVCLVSEEIEKAEDELERYLDGLKKDQQQAKEAGLVQTDTPYTVAHVAAEFLQFKEGTKKGKWYTLCRHGAVFLWWCNRQSLRLLCHRGQPRAIPSVRNMG